MITIADLDRILSMMKEGGLQTLKIREGEKLISLRLSGGVSPIPEREEILVRSPAIGRFLRIHPGQDRPLVDLGDMVVPETIVGLLENGPILVPILAGHAGEISRVDAEEGSLLGHGVPVITLLAEVR